MRLVNPIRIWTALSAGAVLFAQGQGPGPRNGGTGVADPRWRTVGSGALSGLPAQCTANRDVYICNGAGCTAGNNLFYCTATNIFTQQGTGGLTDPGSNGPIKRTGVNTTAPATAADLGAVLGLTTRGDTTVQGASGPTRLPVGAANTVFGSNGTDPFYTSDLSPTSVTTIQPTAVVLQQNTGGTDEALAHNFKAVKFNSGSVTGVGSVTFWLKKDPGTTDLSYLEAGGIAPDNAGVPGTKTISGTSLNARQLTTSYQPFQFRIDTSALTPSTNYWIVIDKATTGGDIYVDSSVGVNQVAFSDAALTSGGNPNLNPGGWTLENVLLRYQIRSKNTGAVIGTTDNYVAVTGSANSSIGVQGTSTSSIGVQGLSKSYIGVAGGSDSSFGLFGNSLDGAGIYGLSQNSYGAEIESKFGQSLYATQTGTLTGSLNNSTAYLERGLTLGAFDNTGSVVTVSDTTASSGNLLNFLKQAVLVGYIDKSGNALLNGLTVTTNNPNFQGSQILFQPNTAGATHRNWALIHDTQATGDFGLFVSATNVGNPGTLAMNWFPDGHVWTPSYLNATSGFQYNSAAPLGFVLRGTGTTYIGAQLAYSDLNGAGLVATPASSTAACVAGTFAFDASFHYDCVATNTWHRVATATW